MKTEKKQTHTPGPWTLRNHPKGGYNIGDNNGDTSFARISDHWNNYEADARLIAAAPDLLEAVKRLIKDLEPAYMPGSIPGSIEAGCAAIAKVEGGK